MPLNLLDVYNRVYDNVYSSPVVQRPFASETTAAYLVGDTVIPVTNGTQWAANDILETIRSTPEQMRVRSVATNNLTVTRGWNNTTPIATSGVVAVVKNPAFSARQIQQSIVGVGNALRSQGIFATHTLSLEVTDGVSLAEGTVFEVWGLDDEPAPVSPYDIISVSYIDSEGRTRYPTYRATSAVPANTTNYYARVKITVRTPTFESLALAQYGRIHVVFRAPLGYANYFESTDLVIPEVWHQLGDVTASTAERPGYFAHYEGDLALILEYGATAALLASTMGPRSVDPGRFTDRAVQPGQGGRDARWYQSEYYTRLKTLSQELKVQERRLRKGESYTTSLLRRRTI